MNWDAVSVAVSNHAVDRYRQRVDPSGDRGRIVELLSRAEQAGNRLRRRVARDAKPDEVWLHYPAIFVVQWTAAWACVVVTVLHADWLPTSIHAPPRRQRPRRTR